MQHANGHSMAWMASAFKSAQSKMSLVDRLPEGDGGLVKRRKLWKKGEGQQVNGEANEDESSKREAGLLPCIVHSFPGCSSPISGSCSDPFPSSPVSHSSAFPSLSSPQDEVTASGRPSHGHAFTLRTHLNTQQRGILHSSGQRKSELCRSVYNSRNSPCIPSQAETPQCPYVPHTAPPPYVEEPPSDDDSESQAEASPPPRCSGSGVPIAATRQSDLSSWSAVCLGSGAAAGRPSPLFPLSDPVWGLDAASRCLFFPEQRNHQHTEAGGEGITLPRPGEEEGLFPGLTVREVAAENRRLSEEGETKPLRVDEPSSGDEEQ
uniref:Uncharacterized protein n=1 Tax=Neospora caninum (strain Liverpool) TaxID=572307 RepID=A0A0F7UAW3_NEOCL|nr:TPA: hypothetical protein BN1204_013755 [Neospora caninum Liverpool]